MRHRSHSAKFLTYLRELCAWRENRAINKNVPRQSFIKDDLLLNICSDCPSSKEDLCKVRGMRDDLAMGKIGDEIIDVIKKVKGMGEKDYVTPPFVKDFTSADGSLLELLKVLLKITAQQHKTVSRIIATEEELKDFCRTEGLKVSGSKQDLEKRIIHYLSTGEELREEVAKGHSIEVATEISLDSKLGRNFKCSEDKREFFEKEQLNG